jgi:hypothetical protein
MFLVLIYYNVTRLWYAYIGLYTFFGVFEYYTYYEVLILYYKFLSCFSSLGRLGYIEANMHGFEKGVVFF